MKKWLSLILVLVLALVLVGCGGNDDPNPTPDDPPVVEDVKPTKIEISGQKEEIEVGEEFTITVVVSPDNATNKAVRYSSSDSSVATVKDGKVTGISAGTATITVTASGDTKVTASFTVTVKGGEEEEPEVIPPTGLEISGPTEVKVNKVIALTVAYTPEDAKKGVTWSSSDESIAKVTNGNVVGMAEGEVVITATSTVDGNVSATYNITVLPAEEEIIEVVNPTSIVAVVSDTEVEVGYKLTARATVEPAGADQTVRWESRNPDIATIDEKGIITAVSKGIAYFTAYSIVDETVKSNRIKVTVVNPPAVDPFPDMKGYTIVLMNAGSALSDLDPFLDGYTGADKLFKQQAWREIERDYNCTITVEAYPDDAPWGDSRYKWINAQAEIGEAKADFYTISSAWIRHFGGAGSAHNAAQYYAKYGKNQMSIAQKMSSTYKGEMYGLSTGLDESKNYADYGLFYNLAWVERLKVESPAKMFNEGRWTYSEFEKWCTNVQALLGEGEYALAGNVFYYWLGMCNAVGITIADPVKIQVTLNNPREQAASDLLKKMYAIGALSGQNSWMESSGLFFDQKAVMTSGVWWFVKADNRWTPDMWGEDTRYGYVSFPRPDDMEKDQQRVGEYGQSLLMFASARDYIHPAGVTYQDVYRAMTEMYLRTYNYYSKDPSYDPDAIKLNTISSKIDDPESVEAAMWWNPSNVIYDALNELADSVSGGKLVGISSVILGTKDYQTFVDEMMDSFVNTFNSVYNA